MELIQIPSSGSNLDKYSQPILADSKMTKSEIIIYDASTKQKIMYLSDEEKMRIANTIITMVKVCLSLKDRAKHEDAVESQMIFSDLNKFDHLTEAEVLLALENGLDGNYLKEHESNVFWNPSNFVLWIKRYLLEKNDVMRKVTNAKPAEEVKPVPNDEVLMKDAIEIINNFADQIQKSREENTKFNWVPGLSGLYKVLVKLKIKNISQEEMLEIWKKSANIKNEDERWNWCRKEAYILFTNQLVDFGCRLDQHGKIKPIA